MGTLRRFNLRLMMAEAGISAVVETGTGAGDSLAWAERCGLPELYSVELEPHMFTQAQARFAGNERVYLRQGDTLPFLEEVLPRITGNKLIFLDAHFAGGADFGLVDYARSATDPRSFPLLDELQALQPCLKADDILLIDDVHIYVPGSFQQGECPEFARRWHENAALFHALSFWRDTHVQTTLKNDEGYILLLPKCWQERFPSWLNILPHDATGQKLQISPGVRGATSTSIQRRICDARFATRYFRGDGIDVGGGGDSLVLFKELFPQVRHMFVYDQAHGDGQLLQNVPDETFDFLYSSHCLGSVHNQGAAKMPYASSLG